MGKHVSNLALWRFQQVFLIAWNESWVVQPFIWNISVSLFISYNSEYYPK